MADMTNINYWCITTTMNILILSVSGPPVSPINVATDGPLSYTTVRRDK